MEQVPNVSDMEAQKQVMSPIVDHFVALQADFQKQLAALRELTDNWRHEKDPSNKLGNNKSDNLYDRSDEPTVLIDANLVPRAVQQAPDVAEPSDLAITRQEQATVDSRDDSKYSLNATKPIEGLDRVDAALSTEIPAVDDLAKISAMDSSRAPEHSSKTDNVNHLTGEPSIDIDKTVVRITNRSDPSKADDRKSENEETVEVTEPTRSHEKTKETHADTSASIDEAAVIAEVTNSTEERERVLPNNGVEVSSSDGTFALDTTNNTEPGQSSSRQETSSGPELPSDRAGQSTATGNSESLVEVGKSAELSGALRVSFQNSSDPRQTDISGRTSPRDESSIADTADVMEKVHASERDLSAREQSDQRVIREIPRQNDEPHVVTVEALLFAVKSLPEQFLTPFITAMQMLSPEKGDVNVTSDVQLMNRLNILHNMKTDGGSETGAPDAEIGTSVDVLRNSATAAAAPKNADEEVPLSAAVLENESGPQSFREKNREVKRPDKSSVKLRNSKVIDKEIDGTKFPDSRMAKSRSSVPDIKQQHQDVRSVRTDTNEPNISQTNIATDLTSETFSDSVDLTGEDNPPEELRTTDEVATSSVAVAEVPQTIDREMHSRKNSLDVVGTPARNNNEENSVGDETVSRAGSAEEMHSGDLSSSHVQSLTASSTHDRSIIQKPVELTISSGDSSTDMSSSSSKEAESSSEKASHEKLLVDNAFDPLLKGDSSQDKSSLASVNDSNAEESASQSVTGTNVSQRDPIAHNSNADHPPVSYDVITNATNMQSANKQDFNKRRSNDSHAHVSISASPISSTSPPAKIPDHSLDVKSPPVEIFDNHGATLRHDKNDTKPTVPKNAVHVSEKVEQTISVTYHTPASDDKNETTLKENVPVEQNTSNDLSITQSRTDEKILPPLTHSHAPEEVILNDLRDQEEKITFTLVKSDDSMIERTSNIPLLTDSRDVINRDKLFDATNDQEIIAPRVTHAKITPPSLSKNNVEINTRPKNTSHLEISNRSDDLKTPKDIKILADRKTTSIPETSKLTVDQNFLANVNKLSGENVHGQSHELSNSNNNTSDNTSPPLPVEHALPLDSERSISYPIDRDGEPYLKDEVSQSHDDKKQDAQTSNSTTRSVLHALKNFNMFLATQTEGRNIASIVNEDFLPDPIIANVSDMTPGIPDTFEIKISESPITTVNDCAPIKNIASIVEREMSQVEGVDIGKENARDIDSSGNEILIIARNGQVASTSSKSSNESSMGKNTEQVSQSRKSMIAKLVKHRSRSPVKKIVRKRSPVKIIKKSGGVPRKNLARKSASPYSTTVTKAKATTGEIAKSSNRAVQFDGSRIKEPFKSTCVASDKTGSNNKSIVDDKILIRIEESNLKPKTSEIINKTVKQLLNNISVQKATGNIKDNRKVSTPETEKISIINNTTNPEPQIKLPIVKKYNGNKSENSKKSTIEYSKNKNIEDVQNKNSRGLKNIKAEVSENQAVKKINHKTEMSNNDKTLIKTKEDNLNSKTFLPSKIPILMQRKITQSTNIASSNSSKININDTSLLKSGSTKLPVMSQAVSKLKIQGRGNVLNPPTMRKIDSKDTNKLMRNQIKSSNGRAIEITENEKDKQILEENHAKGNTVESEETEEPPKVKSIESELNENSQASNSKHNDPSTDLSKQLEVENAIEESSGAFSSDSEYSEEDEDTGTTKYISDHNSEYNSVEEFTDAELLLEKTLNEIRSEISESEEECTSESEKSEDVTYSYETESHDSTSFEGSVDEREIKSSELEDSEEDMYDEEEEEGGEEEEEEEKEMSEVEISEQFEVPDKETDDMIHSKTNDSEANISNRTESNSEITQKDEENNLKAPEAATAIIELSRPETNAEIDEKTSTKVPQKLKTNSNTVITDSAAALSTKVEQSKNIKSKEDVQSKKGGSKKNQTKLEDASEIKERDQSVLQKDMLKTLKITSHESREKRAKIGRRASTGSKEIKIEKDDTLKGVDRARAPKKPFSLVASFIRRFEGEEKAERAHVESIRRKRQESPKTEREVSKRELPSDTRPPLVETSVAKVLANFRVAFSAGQCLQTARNVKWEVGKKIERNR